MYMPSDAAVVLRNLWLSFEALDGSRSAILKDVSIMCPMGTVTVITGPTGSGKTSLLEIAVGLTRPDRGDVWVYGKELWQLTNSVRTKLRRTDIAYMSDESLLLDNITVAENIDLPRRIGGFYYDKEDERMSQLMDRLGMKGLENRCVLGLSCGQRRLVTVARTLLSERPVMVLDEPTAHLDKSLRQRVVEEFQYQRDKYKRTIVFSTHHEADALGAEQIFSLEDGAAVRLEERVDNR